MSDRSLPDGAPGTYVPYGRQPYYLPDPLPPDLDPDVKLELFDELEAAIRHLGRLDGIAEESGASPLLYTMLVRREAVESVVLEGAEIDIEDVFRTQELSHDETVRKDVQEALNYERTITEGVERVRETGEITLDLLSDLHVTLMDGVRGHCESPGAFRPKPMHLPAAESFREPFVPPAPDRVPELMMNLEEYVASGDNHHDLIRFAITHYQFETIHPFEDGNGRLGRILITLQLVQHGHLSEPYLYPSAYFNRHKVEYARRMREVSETGAWVPWLRFFIEGISEQAAEAVERTEALRDLRRAYERRYGHEKTAADRLAMRLFRRPYVTANDVAEMLDVTGQTARNAIGELVANDVLVETTGKERYREYKAVDIFDVLDEPLE
jgi:Fic family protein